MNDRRMETFTTTAPIALTMALLALAALVAPSRAAAQATEPAKPETLAIARIEMVERPAAGYRDASLKPIAAVAADRPIYLYVEPTGMATKHERGEVKALLVVDLTAKAADGKVVREGKAALRIPISVRSRTNVPLINAYTNITIGALYLEPGAYELVIRFNDAFGTSFAERTLSFTQTAPASKTSRRR